MKKNKKIILFLVFALSFFSPFSSLAYTFSVGPYSTSIDVNEILQEANFGSISNLTNFASQSSESRYGFTQDVWRNAQRKVNAPRVEIFFDNTNPKPGEKVSAHVVPEFFKNDPQNLYYTWYIIHTRDGRPQTATNTIADGKREAARIMAKGDYDPDLDGQTYPNSGDDPDRDGWPTVDPNSYSENKVAAPLGGADGVGGLAEGNDNIEPYNNANEYCQTQGNHGLTDCSLNTNKSSFNQYYTLQANQPGDFCQSCQASLSFTGTLSPTGNPVGSISNPDNQCCYVVANPSDPTMISYDPNVTYCPTSYDSAYESCFDYNGLQTYNSNLITNCLNTAYQSCEDYWNNLHTTSSGEPTGHVSRCYKHNFGVNNPDVGYRGYDASSNTFGADNSGSDVVVDCIHKWKDAPGYTSGSGKFPTGEEQYWKTDPIDPDTDGDGTPDEGDIIGLNQQDFTWNYMPGDRVGVVVEGTSLIPIDESSAYYKIMWGYDDTCDSTKKDLLDNDECEDADDYGYGFLATESPNEQGDDKLKVSLAYTPDKPLADISDSNKDNITSDGTISNADPITVTSSLDNTDTNPGDLYYTWQIQKGDPQTDTWTEIKDISGNFSSSTPTSGMGVTQFSFTPKTSALSANSTVNYFKVTLTISNTADLKAGRGRTSVIIPVNTKGIRVSLHKVDVVNGKAVIGDAICTEGLYLSLCPVVKGQMLAAVVSGGSYSSSNSQFAWTVDNVPVYPPENAAQLFDGWSNTAIFLPITKDEKEIVNISVTATSKDELLPATGTRLATVVHPAAFIKSGDTGVSWSKVYTAPDPNLINVSNSIEGGNEFQSVSGANALFFLDFVPDYLLTSDQNTSIDWSVNRTSVSDPNFYTNNPFIGAIQTTNNGKQIVVTNPPIVGDFYTLGVDVKKYWSEDERSIAYSAWGIVPNTLASSSSASIEMASEQNPDIVGSAGGPGQILAAIGTHLPHYFMYLLRLILTMTVMLIISAGFYGISQRMSLFNEEK